MKRREMKLLLEERFERIALLETRIDTMDQLVEGYRSREQGILDTLQTAKENAERITEEAKSEAKKMRDNAMREANALIVDAAAASDALRAEAERRAKEIMITAKAESERMLRDAEIIKREYEEMVELFNAMLEHNASELQTSAARFAEFVKQSKIEPVDNRLDGEAFYKSVGALSDVSLPDPSGDPSLLMRNIYRIQNRPMPEDKSDNPAEENDDAQQADEEAYSETASVDVLPQSRGDAQFEQAKTNDNANSDSAFIVRADGCHLTQAQAEHMFDALFAAPDFSSNTAEAKPAPEPAEIPSSLAAGGQAEDAERAFDDLFEECLNPDGMRAQEEVPPAQAEGPEGTAQSPEPDFVSEEPAAEQSAAETEPNETIGRSDAERAFDDFFSVHADPAFTAPIHPEPVVSPASFSKDAMTEQTPAADLRLHEGEGLFSGEPASETESAEDETDTQADAKRAIDDTLASLGAADAGAEPEPAVKAAAFAEETGAGSRAWQPERLPNDIAGPEKEVITSAQKVSETDAEYAFDEFIRSRGGQTGSADEEQAVPQQGAPAESWEPQSEKAQNGDHAAEMRDNLQADTEAQMREIDELLAGYETPSSQNTTEAEVIQETTAQPISYSEPDWLKDASSDGQEPQAKGAQYSAIVTAEEEPVPAPRRYNEFGELREWEPDAEPDIEDLPTVSRYVGETGAQEEVSLDALLEEIIKAGE